MTGCAVVAAFAGLSSVGVPSVVEPAVTVTVADLVVLAENAVMVTGVLAETGDVVTVKVAWVWPAATVTMGGTWAVDGLPVARVIDIPPAGAAELSATVPVAVVPPVTLAGEIANDASDGSGGAGGEVDERGSRHAAGASRRLGRS